MRRRWLRWVLVLLATLVAGNIGLSLALRGDWARRGLSARLSAGFGRPVEVGHFGFNLLSGLRLEAQSVTVYDDPRFGQEYFLRAEQLTASVRWSALLQGRFEFDTVSLTRPSLNLVRLSDGQWNIESWLPPLPSGGLSAQAISGKGAGASASAPAGWPPAGAVTARLSRIEVEGGRINFKRDSRKLPLALVAVEGRFDHDAAGHWNIDVQANPMRAPASLQQAGTLRLRGVVGGVSARLRPASLSLSWEDASLADLSRLAQGRDYGIRGTFDAELTAHIEDSPSPASSWGEWAVEGRLRLQGVHGWALAGRASDPGANVNFQARWRPAEYRLLVTRCLLEAPQSRIEAVADLDWSRGFHPQAQVTLSRVALADLLAWRRALRAGVADDLTIEGALEARATLSGWPVRVENLAVASEGATIRTPALPGPIRVGPIVTRWAGETLRLRPSPVSLPVAASARPPARDRAVPASPPLPSGLLVEGTIGPLPALNALPDVHYRLAVSGSARRAQDLLAVARAWSGTADPSWTAEGPVSLQLVWAGSARSGTSFASGTIQARGVQLTTALLNRPLLANAATIDLRGQQRRILLQDVQAAGGQWTGSLRGPAENGAWDFDLSADRLDAADFYAWLGAPARPNLLQRILPFGAAAASGGASGRADALKTLQARGRLRVAELQLSPLHVEKIDAAAVIDGPSLILQQGRAGFYGGRLSGNFEARLLPEPSYSFDGQFARVDLRDLAALAALPGRVGGLAAGELKLAAHGSDRAALAASLQGQGLLRAGQASFGQFEWKPAKAGASPEPGSDAAGRPVALTTRFQVGARQIRLDEFLLARPGEQTEVTGAVDFTGRLDLRVQSFVSSGLPLVPQGKQVSSAPGSQSPAAAVSDSTLQNSWTIAGTLDAPRVTAMPVSTPGEPAGVPSASASR
jgi:AsmA family/AsmA-like C-terminal region